MFNINHTGPPETVQTIVLGMLCYVLTYHHTNNTHHFYSPTRALLFVIFFLEEIMQYRCCNYTRLTSFQSQLVYLISVNCVQFLKDARPGVPRVAHTRPHEKEIQRERDRERERARSSALTIPICLWFCFSFDFPPTCILSTGDRFRLCAHNASSCDTMTVIRRGTVQCFNIKLRRIWSHSDCKSQDEHSRKNQGIISVEVSKIRRQKLANFYV